MVRTIIVVLSAAVLGCSANPEYSVTSEAGTSASYEEGMLAGADDVWLYYRKVGHAQDVVILPSRLFAFDDFARLGEHFTLISYDMRNRGRSSRVENGDLLTLEKDVEDLEAVRAHFGVERFSAIGYSYLGKVVVMYARDYPEHVERLVQIGPVPPVFDTTYPAHLTAEGLPSPYASEDVARIQSLREQNYHETHPREYCDELWRVLRFSLVHDPANVARYTPYVCDMANEWPINLERHMQHAFVGSAQTHVITPEEIAEVTVPVLTIHGRYDRNAPYGAGREWALRLPNAKLITANAAHHVWADAPGIIDSIIEFLDGEWPANAERIATLDPLDA